MNPAVALLWCVGIICPAAIILFAIEKWAVNDKVIKSEGNPITDPVAQQLAVVFDSDFVDHDKMELARLLLGVPYEKEPKE